jgi:uncharacterized membrane protein
MGDRKFGPMTDGPENSPPQDSRTRGALCYFPFIGWIISVFFILTERHDRYVRFSAIQSLLLLFAYVAVSIALDIILGILSSIAIADLLLRILQNLLPPAYLFLSVFLIYKGYLGERVLLPKIGGTAEKHM